MSFDANAMQINGLPFVATVEHNPLYTLCQLQNDMKLP